MGLLDKIMFWKKEPEPSSKDAPDLGPDLGLGKERDLGLGEESQMPNTPHQQFQQPSFQPPQEPSMSQPQSFSQQPSSVDKDIQLLSAKMDSLKAILDNINQRLANIERIAQESQESENYGSY